MWDLLLAVIFLTGLFVWITIAVILFAIAFVTIIDWWQQRGS